MGWGINTTAIATVAALFASAFLLSSVASQAAQCATIDATTIGDQDVAGYSGDQLVNAAAIMNAATQLGLDSRAQAIGVMTAMGESSLRVLDHGDAVGPDSRGLFQQRDSWGSLADRMDATRSAGLFFARLITVSGWETMTPTAAAHAVQGNADPDHYTRYFAPATEVVQALAAHAPECALSGDKIELAKQLVAAADDGRLRGSVPDHIKEIRWIAQGKTVENCDIDVRILQVMVIALNEFGSIGISDINRHCTNQAGLGAGTNSSHWGPSAVDFTSLGGRKTNGADRNAIRLVSILDPLMPQGARIEQQSCRASAGTTIATRNFTQFGGNCTHLHVDLASV